MIHMSAQAIPLLCLAIVCNLAALALTVRLRRRSPLYYILAIVGYLCALAAVLWYPI